MNEHDIERLLAFLAGDLSAEETEAVDAHLLECGTCWRSVHLDIVGRSAAESLREFAPPDVRDRVRLAVSLAPIRRSRRPWWRRSAEAMTLVAMIAAALLSWSLLHSSPNPPDSLALIVHRVRTATAHHEVPTSIELDGRHLRLEAYELGGGRVVVALGTQPFPMPTDAHTANGQINAPWSAPVDGLRVLCINAPRPALLVADKTVGADSLAGLAHRLALS